LKDPCITPILDTTDWNKACLAYGARRLAMPDLGAEQAMLAQAETILFTGLNSAPMIKEGPMR
jgi:hypothetical protein